MEVLSVRRSLSLFLLINFLSAVGLEKIDDHAFYRLANLIELDISHNNLREIPTPNFVYLPHLRNLDLSSNRISEVNSEAFKALKNMKDLSLERYYFRLHVINTIAYFLRCIVRAKASFN